MSSLLKGLPSQSSPPDENQVSQAFCGSAVCNLDSSDFTPPTLAVLTNAQLTDYASKTIVTRYSDPPSPDSLCVASPLSSPAPTIVSSRKSSMPTYSTPTPPTMERLKWRLASGFFAFFMCGWGDGVTGTIFPYFMADYHVSFLMSSLLFAGSTLGFLIGALLLETIVKLLGQIDLSKQQWSLIPIIPRKHGISTGFSPSQARFLGVLISSTIHATFFVMMGLRGGFGGSFAAYAVAAFARAILTGTLNTYYSQGLPQSIGWAYGLWSVGGAISPIVSQSVIAMGVPWYKFYYGSLILSGFNSAFLIATYRPTPTEFERDRQKAMADASVASEKKLWSPDTVSTADELQFQSAKTLESGESSKRSALSSVIRLPYQWAIGLFVFIYCGCETSTQGFMVSYLLGTQHANPETVGYVTSGFWAGIAISRFIWGYLTTRLDFTQRKYLIQGCTVIGFIMEVLIWKVNSNIGDSLATAIVGFVFGPIFPGSLGLANDILPSELRMVSMALISASSSFGASFFPFLAGVISSVKGIDTIVYITVPLTGILACLWALFPSKNPSH